MPARLAVWGTAAILIGCATTTELPPRAAAQAIDLDYRLAALPWGEGGHMLFLAKAVEEDGELKLCGAYGLANVRKPAKGSSRAAAESAVLRLGSVQVAQGLGFMAPHDGSRAPLGQPARCALTGLDWRPEFAEARPSVRLRSDAL